MTGASVEGQPVPLLCESDVNQGWAVVLFDMPAWLTESNYCLHGWQLALPATCTYSVLCYSRFYMCWDGRHGSKECLCLLG